MTEKTVLQQISNLVFDIQHTDDLQEAFDKAGEILKLTESDHQPAFAVGEYYVILNVIYKVTEIVGDTVKILSLHPATGELCKEDFKLSTATEHTDKPATVEQIEMFKLAEIKSDIGLIIKNGDADWIEIVEDIEEYLAEELQEVADGKNRKN